MSMLPRGTVRIVRNLQYSHLSLTLCIPLFLLGQCVLGVSGDDTIKAGKAASQMNKAITLALLRCQEENGSQRSLIGTPPQPCIGATEKQKLLRRDDVEKCINTILFWQCSGDITLDSFAMNQVGIGCPARSDAFLFNNLGPPWQGHILSISSGDNGTGGTFYFACF